MFLRLFYLLGYVVFGVKPVLVSYWCLIVYFSAFAEQVGIGSEELPLPLRLRI